MFDFGVMVVVLAKPCHTAVVGLAQARQDMLWLFEFRKCAFEYIFQKRNEKHRIIIHSHNSTLFLQFKNPFQIAQNEANLAAASPHSWTN